jgi:peptide/nickel transport system permease protein
VQALGWRDYPVVQGVVMITALVFLTINLLVDLLYVAIDPRIRLR